MTSYQNGIYHKTHSGLHCGNDSQSNTMEIELRKSCNEEESPLLASGPFLGSFCGLLVSAQVSSSAEFYDCVLDAL